MNNNNIPFNFFNNGNLNQDVNSNPFLNMLQNNGNLNQDANSNPFLNMLQNNPFLNNLQQPQPQTQPQPNNIFLDMFSKMVDKNMVNSVFANMVTTDIFPIKLHEPERTLDLLLYLSEKALLSELNETNKLEFEEFIKMMRTSDNSKPERKLALFLNLLNYYTTKQGIVINKEEENKETQDEYTPHIEPVD